MLVQEGCSLTFNNKQLCDRNLGKSTYEKETLTILRAIDLLHPYFMANRFHIKIDHGILKYFLEQKLSSLEKKSGSQKC